MQSNIFIPKLIHVGFQKREDTYTGKLGYVIYTDQKGIKRKETSWNNWINKEIETLDLNNEPVEGFVLNKNVGGVGGRYSWDMRTEKVRIYHPKGFEFEITIPNLLYILENTSSIKGKGLEGLFVLGWDKQDLVLIPEHAPEFQEMLSFTELQSKKVQKKDLIPGGIYLNKDNEKVVFLKEAVAYSYGGIKTGKKLFFGHVKEKRWERTYTTKIENIKAYTGELADSELLDTLFYNLDNNTTYKPKELHIKKEVLADYEYINYHINYNYSNPLKYRGKFIKLYKDWHKVNVSSKDIEVRDLKGNVITSFNSIKEMLETNLFTFTKTVEISEYEYVEATGLTKDNFGDKNRYILEGDKYVEVALHTKTHRWEKNVRIEEFKANLYYRFGSYTPLLEYDTVEELLSSYTFYNKILTNII